jgi:hypothetical protein
MLANYRMGPKQAIAILEQPPRVETGRHDNCSGHPSSELFLDSSKLDFRGWFCKLAGDGRGGLVGPASFADLNAG